MAKQTKEFYAIDEIASILEVDRTSVYPYIKALQIERIKFPTGRKRYITAADFERIKKLRADPTQFSALQRKE